MKIITACIDLTNMDGFLYADTYTEGKFKHINKTLRNNATHINDAYTSRCTKCGHTDANRHDNRVLIDFWQCDVCENYNPMVTGGEDGIYACPCGNEFDTN